MQDWVLRGVASGMLGLTFSLCLFITWGFFSIAAIVHVSENLNFSRLVD